MSNLTVKQLKDLLRNSKKATKQCDPYSNLKKSQLIDKAVELNLITEFRPSRMPKVKNLDKYNTIKRAINRLNPDGERGKKKKASLLRRLERVNISSDIDDEIINRLQRDLDVVYSLP